MSVYEEEIWQSLPEDRGEPPPHLQQWLSGLPRARRALDLGCGDGWLTLHIPAEEVVGADPSWTALDRARTRLPDARLVPVPVDGRLVLEDGGFDLVVMTEVLQHVRDVQLLLSEARRVLEPGGRLAVSAPANNRAGALKLFLRGWFIDPMSPVVRFFSMPSLRACLEEMGFDVEAADSRRGSLLVTATR
ncbi:MAG: class I SAM-dependent methyltransferase [Thermoleophilaceae bacterium]|nr:class I SAM-dependent methyltransferase [Thermoleophilaceae bacterium]